MIKALLLLVLILSGCKKIGSAGRDLSSVAPTPTSTFMFASPNETKIFDKVVEYINLAEVNSKIHASYYLLQDQNIINALKAARGKGVEIKIIVDDKASNDVVRNQSSEICLKGMGCVKSCFNSCLGIKESYDTINHNKFFLFSKLTNGLENVVLQSSSNLYEGSLTRFQDLMMIHSDEILYEGYKEYFDQQMAESLKSQADQAVENSNYTFSKVLGESGLEASFFPKKDGSDPIVDVLDDVDCESGSAVHVAMAYFYDNKRGVNIAPKLKSLSDSGCEVKVITGVKWDSAAGEYKSPGFEVMNFLGAILVKVEYDLHSKFMVVRSKMKSSNQVESLVIAGSHNYTYSALRQNDEIYIKIKIPEVYDQYLDFWNTIYAHSSTSSRDKSRKVDLYYIAKALKGHYLDKEVAEGTGSYTQPETGFSDCSTGDSGSGSSGSACGTDGDWSLSSDLRVLIVEGRLSYLPLDPINSSGFNYYYEPYNGGATQDNNHSGWKFKLCASKMEVVENANVNGTDTYCVYKELGE